jgi:hypothetical protein
MIKKIYSAMILFFSSIGLFAQTNSLYFMSEVPQSIQANPAFRPACNFFFTVADVSVLAGQNGFAFNDVFVKSDEKYILSIDNLYNQMPNSFEIKAFVNAQTLSLGFKTKKGYFSFQNNVVVNAYFTVPKSFLGLKDGNWDMEAMKPRELDFSGFGPNLLAYVDHRFAYSRNLKPNLTVGAAFHLYNGLVTFDTYKSDLSITTNAESYSMNVAADLEYRTNAKADVVLDAEGNIKDFVLDEDYYTKDPLKFIKPINKGFGFDIGAVYKPNQKTEIAGSLLNLGFIKWNDGIIANAKGNFTFSGIDFTQYVIGDSSSTDSLGSDLLDSLINSVDYAVNEAQTFKTWMPLTMNISASRYITKRFQVGAMLQTRIYDKKLHPAFMLSSNFHTNLFNFGLTYSMMEKTYANIGFGFGLKLAPLQVFVVSDSWTQMASPYNLKFASVRVGVNLMMGCKRKADLPIYKDEI